MATIAGVAFAGGQGEADAVTRPRQIVIGGPADVQLAVGPDGSWIVIFEEDVAVDSSVTISGEVYEEEGAEEPRRKLALYAQDADRNVTARYTLTVPALVIQHVDTRIQTGTVAGDVYVEAEGFQLRAATVDGDLYFASEALRDSAEIDDESPVTGSIAIGTGATASVPFFTPEEAACRLQRTTARGLYRSRETYRPPPSRNTMRHE